MHILSVVCPRCGTEIKQVERKRKLVDKITSGTICTICRQESLERMRERERSKERKSANSLRMQVDNPMTKSAITRAKVVSARTGIERNPEDYEIIRRLRKVETKEEMSLRMQKFNPMHNPETVENMKKTLLERIASGEITYKKGPEHHLWKGNRDFNNSCRRDLYPVWVYPILERDGFKCTNCGSSKNLQVHHIKPLREFLNDVKIKYNINTFADYTADELYPYVQEVVSNHKLEDGITLCEICHYQLDEHYHNSRPEKYED